MEAVEERSATSYSYFFHYINTLLVLCFFFPLVCLHTAFLFYLLWFHLRFTIPRAACEFCPSFFFTLSTRSTSPSPCLCSLRRFTRLSCCSSRFAARAGLRQQRIHGNTDWKAEKSNKALLELRYTGPFTRHLFTVYFLLLLLASLSLSNPPLLCVGDASKTAEAPRTATSFTLNILNTSSRRNEKKKAPEEEAGESPGEIEYNAFPSAVSQEYLASKKKKKQERLLLVAVAKPSHYRSQQSQFL